MKEICLSKKKIYDNREKYREKYKEDYYNQKKVNNKNLKLKNIEPCD